MKPVRIGICGMGAAGRAFVPAIRKHPGFDWVALAEPDDAARGQNATEFGVPAYASLSEMLVDAPLDAVYVASPTLLHAAHVQQIASAGKHVLVEKPMAVSLGQADAMVAAAERHGVVLLVGHSHSHDQPIRAMRQLIDDGTLGAVQMVHTWCYSDWMRRPRRADEFDAAQGGGVTMRQGAHQFDILRLLCGGLATRVRARGFDWDPTRPGTGAHSVWIDFDNGAVATAVYNGYGGLGSAELCFGISEWGLPPDATAAGATRQQPVAMTVEEELQAKRARSHTAIAAQAPHQPFFGLTLVSCERGDIRQSPQGLYVHERGSRREIVLPTDRSPRDLVLAEFHDAIASSCRPQHDGRWGRATLEICIAAGKASASGQEVALQHQVAVASGAEKPTSIHGEKR